MWEMRWVKGDRRVFIAGKVNYAMKIVSRIPR